MQEASPTVFIIDDDTAARDSLRWLVESVGWQSETFANAREFLESYKPDRGGCAILDVRMPGMSGLELQSRLCDLRPGVPIIFMTAYADVPMAVRAMKNGAVEFLEKPFSEQILLDAIHRAVELDVRNRRREALRAKLAERADSLTPREREVMNLVVTGQDSRTIAQQLSLSPKTVEIHRSRVMEKFQAKSLVQLVRYVLIISDDRESILFAPNHGLPKTE